MSDQSDALNRKAMEAGLVDQPKIAVLREGDGDGGRPEVPWVRLPIDGHINNDFNREVGAAVSGKGLYRLHGKIVTVTMDELTGLEEVEEMDGHRFRDWVENHLMCYKELISKNGAYRVKATMALDTANTCLASDGFRRQQPRLLRVNHVRLPIQRKSGAIELLPAGYDAESCILTVAPGWEYDETMTVEQAKHVLDDLDREFPFQDARSRSVSRAALLSQFGYFLQAMDSKRLGFLFHANSTGSGKTLLVDIALTLAWKYAVIEAMLDDPSKFRDRVDTAILESQPYLVFDDLDQTYLKSGALNSFMTADWWGGRLFHAQRSFRGPKTPVVFITANNLEIAPDIERRTLRCDLFTMQADVQERKVERVITAQWVRSPVVHAQICSALWTLIRSWRDGGRPKGARVVAGYHQWCEIFGGILVHAGMGDPCAPAPSDGFGNTEFQDMHAMLTVLAEGVTKVQEYEFQDLVQVCREQNCFPHLLEGKMQRGKGEEGDEAWFELSPKANSRFGLLLMKYGGKAFLLKDGRRAIFDHRGKNRNKRYMIAIAESK